jgi:hypothetical protein
MITGIARLAPGTAAPVLAPVWRMIAAAALALVLAWFVASGLSIPRL